MVVVSSNTHSGKASLLNIVVHAKYVNCSYLWFLRQILTLVSSSTCICGRVGISQSAVFRLRIMYQNIGFPLSHQFVQTSFVSKGVAPKKYVLVTFSNIKNRGPDHRLQCITVFKTVRSLYQFSKPIQLFLTIPVCTICMQQLA